MFSIFFIHRPVFAKVISIFVTVIGLIAINLLPVAEFPEMTPPMVSVSCTYTGGSATVVEESVTRPLEEQINGVQGMIYMQSTSTSDGSSKIDVYFEPGYPLDIAAVDVQNRVSIATPQLPEDVKRTGVKTEKQSPNMVQILTVESSNPAHDGMFLSNFASINIVEELKRIKGVGSVINLGEQKYSMRVWLDANKMAALGISTTEVINAIQQQNKQAALGQIGKSPMPKGNEFQYTITSKTRLSSTKEFEEIVVRSREDGTLLKVRDIGRVELGAELYGWYSQLDKGNSAMIGIYQLPGANALDIATEVQNTLKRLESRFPEGMVVRPTYDTTKFVEISMKEVVETLFEALILVILVVYLFLQSWRTTLIPTIAIPVSLIGTFGLMLAMGFSINTLTLFGLILAIGIVVDDAIIVVENVERNLEEDPDLSVKDAAIKAMKEVFGPVIATTLVLLAVFVPVSFIPGISGALYQQFAVTIAMAVLISSINALTLSPALSATILKRRKEGKKAWVFRKFDAGLEWFKRYYIAFLRRVIRYWYVAVGTFGIGIALTYFVFQILPTGFIPDEDKGTLAMMVQLQPGASLERTKIMMSDVQQRVLEVPGVAHTLNIGGYNMLTRSVDSSSATIFIVLKDWNERTTPDLQVNAIIENIKKTTNDIDEATVMVFNMPAIPGISSVGGFELKIQDYQSGPLSEFEGYVSEMIREAMKDPRIMFAQTSFKSAYPELQLDIDRNKAQTLNVDMGDVFSVLQTYLGSAYVNDFTKFGKVYRVFVQAEQEFRSEQSDITKLFVPNKDGEMVPLSAFVKINRSTGPTMLEHFNAYRAITINGVHNIKEGYSSGQAIEAMEEIAARVLPPSYGYEWSGMALQEKQAGNAAAMIFLLSLFIVFLFLAAQYESWIMPAMIMLPIPVVMLGALGANMLAHLLNNTYTQIGMVLLIGMSSKNAILIVEFAKELREGGMDITEAAIEAASQRLRPILMTIFSFLLGILPLVIATGAGAAARNSLGTAVFGGMIMSTLLTLLFTPVLFVVLQKLREPKTPQEANA